MTAPRYRGRFAPSPTGDLHFGSLLTAFASWARARQHAGAWIVRVEDLDPPREIPGASARQLEALAAHGLVSDEPVLYQSQGAERYDTALQRLLAASLAFECRCSRSDLAEQHGIHRRCVARDATRPAAIRARVSPALIAFDDALQGTYRQDVAEAVGDFVLRRVEGWAAYQLAVVVDDAVQGITEVVRGNDLLDSTPRQIWLQRALGLATPAYLHLPLALDSQRQKLSKSFAALPLDLADPLPAMRTAWTFLGQDPAIVSDTRGLDDFLARAIRHFDFDRVPRQDRTVPVTPAV